MLYKQINLSTSYTSCSEDSSSYAFSLSTYIIQEDKQVNLFVELDNIFEYIGIKDIEKVINEIKKIKSALLQKGTINNKTRNFIYYKHLNLALAIAHFYLRKNDNNTNELKNAIGDLYFNIVSEWKKQYPNLVGSLDLFIK